MSSKLKKVLKIVKINPERGYKGGLYFVVGDSSSEYTLQHVNSKETVQIFKAHCFEDFETKKAFREYRIKRAEELGA